MTARVGPARHPLSFHARLEVTHLVESFTAETLREGEVARGRDQSLSQLRIAGQEASLDQSLVLPRLGPALVVLEV